MKKKEIASALVGGIIGGALAIAMLLFLSPINNESSKESRKEENGQTLATSNVPITLSSNQNAPSDFVYAAKVSRPAVVHIRVVEEQMVLQPHPLSKWFGNDFFYTPQRQRSQRYGSGVIISSNGYIVTNKHVVGDGNGEIQVSLFDGRVYQAQLVGSDPSTDLAVLKIEEEGLPFLKYGNSDEVQVGEWVLAVGNPFNLTSTVTAGIVSAKGRNLDIIPGQFSLRSFIQTDAAVNPGNSGGALVNLKGELIGINIAIATPTGVYAGYSFAVPVNIVRKVVGDIIQYGYVRRGFLGITYRPVMPQEAEELGMDAPQGVIIVDVMPGSPAGNAGLQPGDVILEINGVPMHSIGDVQEYIAQHGPGDNLQVKLLRDGKIIEKTVKLASKEEAFNSNESLKKEIQKVLGIEVATLPSDKAQQLGVPGGVIVEKVYPEGRIARYTGVKEGFIILRVNGRRVYNVSDFYEALTSARGSITLEGIYPGSRRIFYYGFSL
ncbi:MAG: Do family serine endopeptidase [Chlorobi bacterium]|nr:Do family serine endopeptidase [Chlorobiota bacterium]